MSLSTSTDPPISTLGIYVDPTMSVKGNIRATHTVATTVGFMQKKVADHVTQTYNLDIIACTTSEKSSSQDHMIFLPNIACQHSTYIMAAVAEW